MANPMFNQHYPDLDLTQSTYTDVLKAHSGDKNKAHQALKNMQNELVKEKEQKVKELQEQFTAIPRSVIIETLESVKWDLDEAIIPLFVKLEEYQRAQEVELIKQYELAQSKLPRPEDSQPLPQEKKEVKVTSLPVLVNELQIAEESYQKKEDPFKIEAKQEIQQQSQHQDIAQEPSKTGTLVVKPDNVDVGSPLTVEWEIINGATSSYDWIGLYQVDQPNKQYLTYEWRGSNDKKGTVLFNAPASYGTYEFRYIPYGSYQHVAISNKVKVGPQVELVATHDKINKKMTAQWNVKVSNIYSRAWIGLFEKSQSNNKNFIAWNYAPKDPNTITFDAPVKPTEYEFRYFVYGYNDVARSNGMIVEGQDTVVAAIKDKDTITAKVSIVTLDPYYDSVWIGLYSTNELNNRSLKRYKWITERETLVEFRAPESGDYEFRLFAHKSYDMRLKSNPIKIDAVEVKQ